MWWDPEYLQPEKKLASISNVTQAKTCNFKGKNVRSAIASKIFLEQVGKVISMLFTFHYYYGVAPFLEGEDIEEGEQPAEAEEKAAVGVPPVADWLE